MKIVQVCDYTAPAKGSMGAERVIERTCKGLLQLGHDVALKAKPDSKLDWIKVVQEIPSDCDIIHFHGWMWQEEEKYSSHGKPWVATIHGGGMETDPTWLARAKNNPHIICVSKFVSDRIGCPAFVHACADPDEFIYSEDKQDYFLYLAGLDWGNGKGLDIFINLAKKLRQFNFVVAGAGRDKNLIEYLKDLSSKERNFKFVGEVNGVEKAKLIAYANGYILPTRLPDASPTTISEALISGTPVIGSVNGSLPELINENVGFICKSESDYVKAILNVNKIIFSTCRQFALDRYSHVCSARKYLTYYESMIKYNNVIR